MSSSWPITDPYKTPRTDIPPNARIYGANAHLNWTLEFRLRASRSWVKTLNNKQLKKYYAYEQTHNSQLTEYEHLHLLQALKEETEQRAAAHTVSSIASPV